MTRLFSTLVFVVLLTPALAMAQFDDGDWLGATDDPCEGLSPVLCGLSSSPLGVADDPCDGLSPVLCGLASSPIGVQAATAAESIGADVLVLEGLASIPLGLALGGQEGSPMSEASESPLIRLGVLPNGVRVFDAVDVAASGATVGPVGGMIVVLVEDGDEVGYIGTLQFADDRPPMMALVSLYPDALPAELF